MVRLLRKNSQRGPANWRQSPACGHKVPHSSVPAESAQTLLGVQWKCDSDRQSGDQHHHGWMLALSTQVGTKLPWTSPSNSTRRQTWGFDSFFRAIQKLKSRVSQELFAFIKSSHRQKLTMTLVVFVSGNWIKPCWLFQSSPLNDPFLCWFVEWNQRSPLFMRQCLPNGRYL